MIALKFSYRSHLFCIPDIIYLLVGTLYTGAGVQRVPFINLPVFISDYKSGKHTDFGTMYIFTRIRLIW